MEINKKRKCFFLFFILCVKGTLTQKPLILILIPILSPGSEEIRWIIKTKTELNLYRVKPHACKSWELVPQLFYMEDPGCLRLRTVIGRLHMATQTGSKMVFSSEGVFKVATRTPSVDVVQNYWDTPDYYWPVVMVNVILFLNTPIAFNHLHISQYRYWADVLGHLCVHAIFDCIHCTSINLGRPLYFLCTHLSTRLGDGETGKNLQQLMNFFLLQTVCLYLRCVIIQHVILFFFCF